MDDINHVEDIFAYMDGEFGERLKAADERRRKRIEAFGEEAVTLEWERRKAKIIAETTVKADAQRARKLLEVSGLGERFFNRTFETFEANANNNRALAACKRMVTGDAKGVLLSGKNGIGKTHLQAAVVNALTAKGKYVRFGNVVSLMDRYGDNTADCDLVCIDDLGQEYAVGYKQDEARVYVYNLVNKFYEQQRGIFITTNLNSKQITKKYGAAVMSRLQEMCELISYNDYDHRKPPVKVVSGMNNYR